MTHPLETYLERSGESFAEFAASVGTTRQTIFRIVKRQNKPSPDLAIKIIAATNDTLSLADFFAGAKSA